MTSRTYKGSTQQSAINLKSQSISRASALESVPGRDEQLKREQVRA